MNFENLIKLLKGTREDILIVVALLVEMENEELFNFFSKFDNRSNQMGFRYYVKRVLNSVYVWESFQTKHGLYLFIGHNDIGLSDRLVAGRVVNYKYNYYDESKGERNNS